MNLNTVKKRYTTLLDILKITWIHMNGSIFKKLMVYALEKRHYAKKKEKPKKMKVFLNDSGVN
jgi:hypothetical protein